jgi:hypothetical protein
VAQVLSEILVLDESFNMEESLYQSTECIILNEYTIFPTRL